MKYFTEYSSPLGTLILGGDDSALTNLWFEGQKYSPDITDAVSKQDLPVFLDSKKWLDLYFSGKNPGFLPALSPQGTPFRMAVWEQLRQIRFGSAVTYGEIRNSIVQAGGKDKLSAQAVGGAVGHNPVAVMIPCHRVIGADGSLTGYAGGIEKKVALLQLEGFTVVDEKVKLRI